MKWSCIKKDHMLIFSFLQSGKFFCYESFSGFWQNLNIIILFSWTMTRSTEYNDTSRNFFSTQRTIWVASKDCQPVDSVANKPPTDLRHFTNNSKKKPTASGRLRTSSQSETMFTGSARRFRPILLPNKNDLKCCVQINWEPSIS